MEEIRLKGGQLHITENRIIYQVKEGHVLVYLLPYSGEKPGRRQFLLELSEGKKVPGFAHESELFGSWRIGLVALDAAQLEQRGAADDADLLSFADRIGVHPKNIEAYDEYLIEKYNLNLVKEERHIYTAQEEQKASREKGLRLIYNLFGRKRLTQTTPESNDALYDTVAFFCNQTGISVASYGRIIESCGRKYTIDDIARISHFVTREVVLEENWYRKDAGPLLVYKKDSKKVVACIPVGSMRYLAYSAGMKKPVMINKEFAQGLSRKAKMFCRPFPNKPMKANDIFLFGIRHAYKSDMVRMLFLAFLGTMIGLLIPYLNEQLYDKFIPMGNRNGLIGLCGVVLACTAGNVSFSIVKNLAIFRSTNSMKYAVQMATYDRLFNLPESFLRQYDSADLAQRAMGITSIFGSISNVFVKMLLSAFFSLLYLWRMHKYSSKLSRTALILLAVVMVYIIGLSIRQIRQEKQKLELDMKSQTTIYQLIKGISKIRIAGVENRALYEYLKPYVEACKIDIKKEKMTIRVDAIVGIMSVVFSMVFYYLMIRKKLDLSVGAFMGFTAAFGSFSSAMLEIVSSLMKINDVKPVYDYCKPILQTPAELDEDTLLPGNLTGDIELSNVSFSYHNDSDMAINQLSLHVKAGEYVGIVGPSGSGKSTLLKLLLGFEKPQIGKIYYDGKDIDSMDKRELRKKIGVVLQDGGLITGSIHENITITEPNAGVERVNEVIREVGLEDDINAMPMGIHTLLMENSGTISGGQKQRIMIARAIIGRPKLIFFDEATSALDNVTQAMVNESLEKLQATKIVIAHRLSTVINCDRILVMENGKLVEEGNYEELMAKKGRFFELAARQMS